MTFEPPPDRPAPMDPNPVRKESLNQISVSVGGPWKRPQPDPPVGGGWNAGDIDFRDDGVIYIRNPYLADAIERHLQRNHVEHRDYLLRIIRDEGWSGPKTNVVC